MADETDRPANCSGACTNPLFKGAFDTCCPKTTSSVCYTSSGNEALIVAEIATSRGAELQRYCLLFNLAEAEEMLVVLKDGVDTLRKIGLAQSAIEESEADAQRTR